MATPPDPLLEEIARLRKRLERERAVRLETEAIAERGLRDLYERQRELQTLERIAARANQDGSIRDVLQFALEEICGFHGWKVGHGYFVRRAEDDASLYPAGIWYAVDEDAFRPFARVTRHSEFPRGKGLPGRALQYARPIWLRDISEDQNFPRLGIGAACGLRGAISFPVMSGETVVAVLEFFDTEIREPDGALLDMMAQIGTQLGRVIERHDAEEALRAQAAALALARDEAEAADRAKSAFLANMSHELRTPLNAIIGFSEMMQHEMAGPLLPRYREYAGDIQRSGHHLKTIINDVLDLSKVAVGALTLREAPLDLERLAESCERLMRPLADGGGVTLAVRVAADLPPLQADETRLKQALLNLLSNAVKFTSRHGEVRLDAGRDGAGRVVIAIADTGIGMSGEDIAVALRPFHQIDNSLSRRYEGTGLGLPLAKAFVELHGGSLVIDSVPSRGTTIQVILPAMRCLDANSLPAAAAGQ